MSRIMDCDTCGQTHEVEGLEPGTVAYCTRCGSVVARRTLDSLHRTAAFSLAALILYIPANIFPILHLDVYGAVSENTVWDGVVKFFQDGNYVIALIVLMASILIPLAKLLGLFILVGTTFLSFSRGKRTRTWVYKTIDVIGRWAMLDVFVVAIWVAVVKMGQLASVTPGPGLLPFGGVVVFTILASASFDTQLIWNREDYSA
jgi:paraquat-inducible protein A